MSTVSLPLSEIVDDSETSSITFTSTSSGADHEHLKDNGDSQQYKSISELANYNEILNINSLMNQLGQITPLTSYNNINVSNSSNVVFGNVIKVKGVLNVNVFKNENNNDEGKRQKLEPPNKNDQLHCEEKSANVSSSPMYLIISRNCWFALDPVEEYAYIKEPVEIVVISHTATDCSTSTSRNMEIIRNMQTFHIDSQGWEDIGYNFLIGCDGNIYEGRGWGVVGAHTFGYNSRSIGISFVGNFMRSLPTQQALKACQQLLIRGISEGHLSNNYKLLGHRQCLNTVSPGRLLYEEISKWEHFYNKRIEEDLKS